jgi:hypothetical protein
MFLLWKNILGSKHNSRRLKKRWTIIKISNLSLTNSINFIFKKVIGNRTFFFGLRSTSKQTSFVKSDVVDLGNGNRHWETKQNNFAGIIDSFTPLIVNKLEITELKIIRYRQAWMETPFSLVFPSSTQPSTFKYSFFLLFYVKLGEVH